MKKKPKQYDSSGFIKWIVAPALLIAFPALVYFRGGLYEQHQISCMARGEPTDEFPYGLTFGTVLLGLAPLGLYLNYLMRDKEVCPHCGRGKDNCQRRKEE